MKKVSQISLIGIIALLLIWQLPWIYQFICAHPQQSAMRFMLFSPITYEFTYPDRGANDKLIGKDLAGHIYSANQLDSVLPLFYNRQLADRNAFPDSIMGKPINLKEIQEGRFMFRNFPEDTNGPIAPLYMLLESAPKRLDFELPKDLFRCTANGLEFITMQNNQIDLAKSTLFTQALKDVGCSFPIIHLHNIPNLRKRYDNGFLLVDRQHQLFHMQMTHNKPVCHRIDLPKDVLANQVFVTEFDSRKHYGFFTDTTNKMYVIDTPSYQIHPLDIPEFNPSTQEIMIIGNPYMWTIRIEDDRGTTFYGLDGSDYHQYRKKEYIYHNKPFMGLHFTSSNDGYVYPHWN